MMKLFSCDSHTQLNVHLVCYEFLMNFVFVEIDMNLKEDVKL